MLKQIRRILVCLHAFIEKMKRNYVKHFNLKYETDRNTLRKRQTLLCLYMLILVSKRWASVNVQFGKLLGPERWSQKGSKLLNKEADRTWLRIHPFKLLIHVQS